MFSTISDFSNHIEAISQQIKFFNNSSSVPPTNFHRLNFLAQELFDLIKTHPSEITPKDCTRITKDFKKLKKICTKILEKSPNVNSQEIGLCYQTWSQAVTFAQKNLLKIALEKGDFEGVKKAIELGANPLKRISNRNTPGFSNAIHYILIQDIDQQVRLKILEYLLSFEKTAEDLSDKNKNLFIPTPLEFLVSPGFPPKLSSENRLELIKFFLNKEIFPYRAKPELLKLLFTLGLSPEYTDDKGKNLLHLLLRSSEPSMDSLQFLLSQAPQLIHQKDNSDRFPLHDAISYSVDRHFFTNPPYFEKMLESLVPDHKINDRDTNGRTVLHELVSNIPRHFEKNKCASKEKLDQTTKMIISRIVALVQRGVDVSIKDDEGRMPLYYAIEFCSEPSVRYRICQTLCQFDAEKKYFPEKEFALAVDKGWKDIASLILESYKIPNKNFLSTHLKAQAKKGDSDMISLLLDKLADLDPDRLDQAIELVIDKLKKDLSHGIMDNKIVGQHEQYAKSEEEYSQNQKFYNRECYKAILQAAENYFNEEWDFEKTLKFLANSRLQIAIALEQFNCPLLVNTLFGIPQKQGKLPGETPIEGKYSIYGEKIRNLDLVKYRQFLTSVEKDKKGNISQATVQAYTAGDRKKLSLTTLKPGIFRHTNPFYIPLALKEVKFLCEELKVRDLSNIVILCEIIGEIYWWVAQAMPWKRGSAAINDMLAKSLLLGAGYQPVEWKEGMIPDCEALTTPDRHEFARNFINLLKEIPKPINTAKNKSKSLEFKFELLKEIADKSENTRVKEAISKHL